ncbi:MAG TPA: dTDP-4-amino-4,6-dideoxygalactose transaminase [Ilumatobacteraceae bacterium]|nr:dTDP-4-amino-4,6-dideoxygalactose transaminase [Ilumatobacteraceae bacterium]
MTIRFNTPALEGRELEYIQQAITGGHTSSSGPFSERASALIRERLGVADVLLTTSCTDALEMTALMLDVGPGDTVIVPSFTFTTTALAYARQGANLRFADIEPNTLGIDPAHVKDLLDDSVRAVVGVHYAGIGCDLDGLSDVLAGRDEITLVEDNAHGLFGAYRGRPLGTFGRFATLSFHETKNFICGEGGALLLNDPADIERAHVLYDKGTNRRAFMLGDVDKYSWKDTGSSFGMSDILAAFLLAQLEESDSILERRAAVTERYRRALAPHADELGIRLPIEPDHCASAHHMFYVLMPARRHRDAMLAGLRERGVQATFHYVPLHSSEAGRRFSDAASECPVTDDISGRLLRLPYYTSLTESDQEVVIDAFLDVARSTSA